MAGSLLKKKSFCVVTGASRGLGKCIAEKLAPKLAPGSLLLLMARTKAALDTLKTEIQPANNNISIIVKIFDQSNLEECANKEIFTDVLKENNNSLKDFEHAMIVHNAGTAGDLTKYASEMTDRGLVESSMNNNVTGTILLNAVFLQTFLKESVDCRTVVNISSLAAIDTFPSWSLYCAGKAARDIFFDTMSKEEPDIRVLNYAPGPLDTDMQRQCRECKDPGLRKVCIEMAETGNLLTCEESVTKLIKLLEENTFPSGKHIDYYDV